MRSVEGREGSGEVIEVERKGQRSQWREGSGGRVSTTVRWRIELGLGLGFM